MYRAFLGLMVLLNCSLPVCGQNEPKHPCITAINLEPEATQKLGPSGGSKIETSSMHLEILSEKGRFRCDQEASPDGLGQCESRISKLSIHLKEPYRASDEPNPLQVGHSAYTGLENVWSVKIVHLGDSKIALLFPNKDGAGSNTVCFLIDSGRLSVKAIEAYGFIHEETRYQF